MTRQFSLHVLQSVVQFLSSSVEPGGTVGCQCPGRKEILRVIFRQKIGVKTTVVPASVDPDIAGAQPSVLYGASRPGSGLG